MSDVKILLTSRKTFKNLLAVTNGCNPLKTKLIKIMANQETENQGKPSSSTVNQNTDVNDEQQKAVEIAMYDRLIERLNEERTRLERDIKHEYRSARRYVRANPEEGIAVAFLSGVAAGLLVGKLFQK